MTQIAQIENSYILYTVIICAICVICGSIISRRRT